MQTAGVKKQWTKLQALTTILPKKVTDQLKKLLMKKESEHTNNDAYLRVKEEILRIFSPSEDASCERAMARVLSTTPGDLARQLVNDLCDHDLDGCCCHRFILHLWKRQLPSAVKQAIAGEKFNARNFNNILDLADKVYLSTRPASSATVAALRANEFSPHNQAFHQDWPEESEQAIAAFGFGRGGGRGAQGGRGGRGGRGGWRGGRGQGRGQSNSNNRGGGQNQGQSSSRGQNQNQNSNNQGQGQSNGGHPRHKTPRHADLPPFESCFRHWTHGKSAHFCMEPGSCPWKNFWIPKSNNQ